MAVSIIKLILVLISTEKKATFSFSNNKIKKPYRSKDNILIIHSLKSYCIEITNTISIDTGITIRLPEKSTGYLATKFRGQNIQTIEGPKTQRLWLTVLNVMLTWY